MPGPDHKASLEPEELKMMVRSIRDVSVVLGSSQKEPTKSECPMIKNIRKSLVALAPIKKGEIFSAKNLCIKRPGTGFEPRRYFDLLGKKAKKNIQADSLITEKDYA
jgi:sialic acid synthase SpsE